MCGDVVGRDPRSRSAEDDLAVRGIAGNGEDITVRERDAEETRNVGSGDTAVGEHADGAGPVGGKFGRCGFEPFPRTGEALAGAPARFVTTLFEYPAERLRVGIASLGAGPSLPLSVDQFR